MQYVVLGFVWVTSECFALPLGDPELIRRAGQMLMERYEKAMDLVKQSGLPENVGTPFGMSLLQEALEIDPTNGPAMFFTGFWNLKSPDSAKQTMALDLMETAFDSTKVLPAVTPVNVYGQLGATILARSRFDTNHFASAIRFIDLAANSAERPDDCQLIQQATMVHAYPGSIEDAISKMEQYDNRMSALLAQDKIDLSKVNDADPYVFCMVSAFAHEVYYEHSMERRMSLFYQVSIRAFPSLLYIHPNLAPAPDAAGNKRKIRIGFASGNFGHGSSVMACFQWMMGRLPESDFDKVFINIKVPNVGESSFLHDATRKSLVVRPDEPGWINGARREIGALNLDILFYLDHTMSLSVHQLAMSRLARVQGTSHGHPVTSGFDRDVMNYFVSWAAAELPYEEAQEHYSEKLLLLPGDKIQQYYEPTVSPDRTHSAKTGMSFATLDRKSFSQYSIPANATWYVCMQKPFKLHPEFDSMLADILLKDPKGYLMLHAHDTEQNHMVMIQRLQKLNVDLGRVRFIPSQPHPSLLALYRVADVVLDSYFAGGCTTSREAFEVGAPVVTLPGKYLGGRWTMGYYEVMGIRDLVAQDKTDYVRLALKLASDTKYQGKIRRRILDNVHKLFRDERAVYSWAKLFKQMHYEEKPEMRHEEL